MRMSVLKTYRPFGVTSPMGLGGGMGIKEEPGQLSTPVSTLHFVLLQVLGPVSGMHDRGLTMSLRRGAMLDSKCRTSRIDIPYRGAGNEAEMVRRIPNPVPTPEAPLSS
jgi:hypothetical protein